MSTNEPVTGAPVIDLGDTLAAIFGTLIPQSVYDLGERTVRRYASIAARDLAVTPEGGELCVIGPDPSNGERAFLSWHDGEIWRTLGYDSGWRTMTLNGPSWTAVAGHTPQYRLKDDVLYLRGAVTYATGVITSAITTLPAAAGADPSFRPAAQTFGESWSSAAGAYQATPLLSTTGVLSIPAGWYSGTPAAGTGWAIRSTFILS